MSDLLNKDGPLTDILSRLTMHPKDTIRNWVIIVDADKGISMVHTLCCDTHAFEAIARMSTYPPVASESNYDPEGN